MKASRVAFAHLEDSNSPGSFFLFSCAFASASPEPPTKPPLNGSKCGTVVPTNDTATGAVSPRCEAHGACGLDPIDDQHDGMAREELHPGLGLGQLDRSFFDVADRSAHGSPIHEIAG